MSECSLSASVIVHRNVCMHTLHSMFIALGVARQLRACGRRKRSGQRVSQTRARWVMIRRTRNHPHRRGGVRRGPRSRRAQEPGAARAVATAAAIVVENERDRSSFERTRHAPLEAFCALASLSARALADFCALPPPIVTVGRRVREQYCFTGENCRVQGVRQAERKTPTLQSAAKVEARARGTDDALQTRSLV